MDEKYSHLDHDHDCRESGHVIAQIWLLPLHPGVNRHVASTTSLRLLSQYTYAALVDADAETLVHPTSDAATCARCQI